MMQEASISGAAKILDITWNEAHGIQKRAVKRGLARKKDTVVRRIGIDEVSEKKGHNYLTIITNLDEATVEHVAEDRKQESLDSYYKSIGPERCAQLEAIGMDMWKPYIASTREHVPDALCSTASTL